MMKRTTLINNPFDLKLKLTADFKFFVDAYREGMNFQYVPMTIATISADGVSDTGQIDVIRSWWAVVKQSFSLGAFSFVRLYYTYRIIRSFITQILKPLLYMMVRKRS